MVTVNARSRNLGTFGVEQADLIHEKSLCLLEEVGLEVDDPESLSLCRKAGAKVGLDNVVKFSRDMVEHALASCPKEVTMSGRNGDVNVLREGVMFHGTGTHRLNILDYETGNYRLPTRRDAEQLSTLADALPAIDIVAPMVSAHDVPAPLADLVAMEAVILNSGKHNWDAALTALEAEMLIDMADILGSGDFRQRPTVSIFAAAASPLRLAAEVGQILITGARRGAILWVGSCASAGATSPATLAGTTLLQNAEVLFLLTLSQIVRSGAPVCYAAGSSVASLRTGVFSLGAVEYSLIADAAMSLANKYNLPLHTTMDTDSPTIDVQNGLQKMLGYFCTMATGANFSNDAGSLNNGVTMSYEQMVIDNEILQIVERFFQGIDVSAESLASELIEKVGSGGEYLTSEHTLFHCRSGEHYTTRLLNYAQRTDPTMLDRAHEVVTEILRTHRYEAPAGKISELKRYVEERSKQLLS